MRTFLIAASSLNWRGEKPDHEGEQHEAAERIDRYV
jgi:hypothetical protein